MKMSCYIVSIEGQGDGSCNFTDFCRPGISVYTSIPKMKKAIQEYCLDEHDIRLSRGELNQIVIEGGYKISEFSWIRIETKEKNPEKLDRNHYDDWELKIDDSDDDSDYEED